MTVFLSAKNHSPSLSLSGQASAALEIEREITESEMITRVN